MAAKRGGLARARKAAGYTQERLAEALGVDRTTIIRWEAGDVEPLAYKRPKLAHLLGITREQLEALLIAPATTPGSGNAVDPSEATDPDHIAKALYDARRYFDGSIVEYFRHRLDRCMADDGELGPEKTLPTVLGLVRAVEKYGREVRPSVQRELLSFGACSAEFAGWLYRDTNDLVQAGYWYDRAMEYAQEAADFPMQGYMLLKKSQLAYDGSNPLRVHTLAQAAQEGPWKLPVNVYAEVTQQAALGLAMIGEPLVAVERQLDAARTILQRAANEQPGEFGAYFNDGTLLLRNASSFTEAGKPARAAAVFADALKSAGLSRRDSGYFRARRAAALALSGEPDAAADDGIQSFAIANATDSRRTLRVLAEVTQTLAPWRNNPKVRELSGLMLDRRHAATKG
jgi:transcriptional regulator with XRE-family HTH domain